MLPCDPVKYNARAVWPLARALQFVGYGGGANFTDIEATPWQVNFFGGALGCGNVFFCGKFGGTATIKARVSFQPSAGPDRC